MTVCRWVFCGGVENTEGAALPRRLSGTSILLTGLLISHNAFNRTQFAVESPRVDCSPLIYTVTNPGLSNTNLSQLASLLGCKGVFNLRSPSFSPGCWQLPSGTIAKARIYSSSWYLSFTSSFKSTRENYPVSLKSWSWWWQGCFIWLFGSGRQKTGPQEKEWRETLLLFSSEHVVFIFMKPATGNSRCTH